MTDIFDQIKELGFDVDAPETPKVIWRVRFENPTSDNKYPFELPKGAKVLTALPSSSGKIDMWVLVDPDAEKETRWFAITSTGNPISAKLVGYVTTLLATPDDVHSVALHVIEIAG